MAPKGAVFVLPVECNVERSTYRVFPCSVQCRLELLKRAVLHSGCLALKFNHSWYNLRANMVYVAPALTVPLKCKLPPSREKRDSSREKRDSPREKRDSSREKRDSSRRKHEISRECTGSTASVVEHKASIYSYLGRVFTYEATLRTRNLR